MRIPMAAMVVCLAATPAMAVCIRDHDISYTELKGDRVVLFHMIDRAVWRNDLPAPCPNLANAPDGFSYQPTDPSLGILCDGEATLHLNGFKQAGCLIGNFTKVAAPRS